MDKHFCAKCGALLGKDEHNYIEEVEAAVCDCCAQPNAETGLGDERIAQRYDLYKA